MRRRAPKIDPNFRKTCGLCGRVFQHGSSSYGKYFSAWKITVCGFCYPNSLSDVPPIHVEKLLEHLASQGIPRPPTKLDGSIAWPSTPPPVA